MLLLGLALSPPVTRDAAAHVFYGPSCRTLPKDDPALPRPIAAAAAREPQIALVRTCYSLGGESHVELLSLPYRTSSGICEYAVIDLPPNDTGARDKSESTSWYRSIDRSAGDCARADRNRYPDNDQYTYTDQIRARDFHAIVDLWQRIDSAQAFDDAFVADSPLRQYDQYKNVRSFVTGEAIPGSRPQVVRVQFEQHTKKPYYRLELRDRRARWSLMVRATAKGLQIVDFDKAY